ncbi:MAG: bifunctional UDP-N-acetylglucosamine diphosphorylase/glucosamine-1-phosphate N-acetyltransferase GlmU [Desulfuromonadales bacterium]|nr:bifunctional UDP-N-acetylglucosamine diphosphorylase/glucosamine-1-phosphate N-acetyltransferase GlmU [Desulfuromonadales bacterium]
MTQHTYAAVILAAGQGTRMKSQLPKVLHPLAGQPLAAWPLNLAEELRCQPQVMVVGHGSERVKAAFSERDVQFVEQREQLGTGHALLCAAAALENFSGTLLLFCGDVPLLKKTTIETLLHRHHAAGAAVSVLTTLMPDPTGYGRIIRENGAVTAIVEEKDASSEQQQVHEINTGIYAFAAPFVFTALRQVGRGNAQGEYYLTDIIGIARSQGKTVCAIATDDTDEAMGINDRVQLAHAATLVRRRINEQLMRAGVTLIDPATTYIDATVTIAADTLVHPNVHLCGTTCIGADCIIEPGAVITDCRLGDYVHIKSGSVLTGAEVGNGCTIGPMAHLRPQTVLVGNNKLGNFVETKKAVFGEKSQASHLTYIGDAEVGKNVNFGCGTITCNYDGSNKYKTIVEDDVFVGSDTQLIAPVTIGRNSLIGAGSTITEDVPPNALALSRVRQKIVPGWRNRKPKTGK